MPQKRKLHKTHARPSVSHSAQTRTRFGRSSFSAQRSSSARPQLRTKSQAGRSWKWWQNESLLPQHIQERLEPLKENLSRELVEFNTPQGPISITRRTALIGAGLLGLASVVTQGIGALTNKKSGPNPADSLTVSKDQVFSRDTCQEVPLSDHLRLVRSFDMPTGTLIYSNSDTLACALVPSKTAHPLVSIQSIQLGAGNQNTLLQKALNHEDGFDILDARMSDEVLIWLEYNMLSSTWKLYAGGLDKNIQADAVLLEEAGGLWEIPSIAVVGKRVFWQVMRRSKTASQNSTPQLSEQEQAQKLKTSSPAGLSLGVQGQNPINMDKSALGLDPQNSALDQNTKTDLPDNYIKSLSLDSSDSPQIVLQSQSRFATQLYPCDMGVVCCPNVPDFKKSVQLSLLSAKDGSLVAQLPLPTGMKPHDAGWGLTGFFFSFNTIYNFGEGISNLGTYVPVREQLSSNFGAGEQASDINKESAQYSNLPWFRYDANPYGNSCWCGNSFIIKGKSVLAGVNLLEKTLFSSEIQNDSSLWGEYLASTGSRNRIISFTEINNREDAKKSVCKVKIYEANNFAQADNNQS